MKKVYKKPTMCVIDLNHKTSLLVGSYNDEIAYMPVDPTDMNNMA